MSIIFLDVGGHRGETLQEVLRPEYNFSVVHCFEPSPENGEYICSRYGEDLARQKLIFHPYGLADRNGVATLYDVNTLGSSLYEGHSGLRNPENQLQITLRRATDFFREEILEGVQVVMKLNCEGSEGMILRDLIESGSIHRISQVMIDFDLRKIRGREREPVEIVRRLRGVGFGDFMLREDVMVGRGYTERIRNWLSWVHEVVPLVESDTFFEGYRKKPYRLKRLFYKVVRGY